MLQRQINEHQHDTGAGGREVHQLKETEPVNVRDLAYHGGDFTNQ